MNTPAARPPAFVRLPITNRLTESLGIGRADQIPRLLWVLGLGGFIMTAGSSFVWPLNTVYIHYVLGRPLTVAGLVLMLQAGSGMVGQLAGGALFDRFGGKAVMLSGLLANVVMMTVIALVRIWPIYVAAMALVGFAFGLVDPATNALVARTWPEGGRRGFNFLYVARNAGVALGTAFGGLVAQRSFALAFLINAAAGLAYAILVMRRVPRDAGRAAAGPRAFSPGSEPRTASTLERSHPLTAAAVLAMSLLVVGVVLIWVSYSQWQAVISVYMRGLGYSLASYSVLWTINGVIIVLGQPAVSVIVRRWLRSLSAQMTSGTLLFAAAFGLIWRYPSYDGFVLGMVVLTVGEMLVLPALPAAVSELAPSRRQGTFQGMLGGAVSAGRMLGPVGGGALYDRWSPPGVLAAASAACLAATVSFRLYRTAARRVPPPAGG